MSGAILWAGVSRLDGVSPVVAIATDGTSNAKTGDMVQTWILRADLEPNAAVATGDDGAVCGSCPLRAGQGCYVTTFQAPLAVYRAWRRGAYPYRHPADVGRGRKVRLGAYGDPAAVPVEVWRALVSECKGHTGYTHSWRQAPDLRGLCMASVETSDGAVDAHAQGWRSFRIGADPLPGEMRCPSSRGVTCAQCGMCDGGRVGPCVVIPAHGPRAGRIDAC